VRFGNTCFGGSDFSHALRYGKLNTNCTTTTSYACCMSCGPNCMTGGHRSNAVYAVNAAATLYPPALPNQVFGSPQNSQMIGASAPYSGIVNNALPYNTNPTDQWYRLEINGTGELIVAAAYRRPQSGGSLNYLNEAKPWACGRANLADGLFFAISAFPEA
jgi:hypothetical protein